MLAPDDVLSEVPIHLDDDRRSHARPGQDQVVTLDALLYATRELADVKELLPRNASHALAMTAAAW